MRDALGVQAGTSVRYVIFEDGVQVLRVPSDDNGLKIHAHDPALLESSDKSCLPSDRLRNTVTARNQRDAQRVQDELSDLKKRLHRVKK